MGDGTVPHSTDEKQEGRKSSRVTRSNANRSPSTHEGPSPTLGIRTRRSSTRSARGVGRFQASKLLERQPKEDNDSEIRYEWAHHPHSEMSIQYSSQNEDDEPIHPSQRKRSRRGETGSQQSPEKRSIISSGSGSTVPKGKYGRSPSKQWYSRPSCESP